MKYIFYLHSNICVIAAYDTIVHLIKRKDDVVVISERNTKFPFFTDKIVTYDIEPIIDQYKKKTSNPLLQIFNYRCDLIPHYKKFANDIIGNEDFIMYIPSYNMYTIHPFLNSKHCKGYYYIEEGTLSYMSIKSLKKRYLKRRYQMGRFFLDFIGVGETLDYKITENFKGCIALSVDAFPWCNEKKQLTGVDGYFSNAMMKVDEIDHLIITDYLRFERDLYVSAFIEIIENVVKSGTQPHIGIKFHPTAYAYEKEKIKSIMEEIKEEYPNISFEILPSDYLVEALMYHRSLNVYSVFNLSSLLLYSIMLKSKSYMMIYENEKMKMVPVPTIKDFIAISNQI